MIISKLVPLFVARFYYNFRAKKGCKGIGIANNVDLRSVKLSNYVNFAHHSQASHCRIGERTSIGRYSKLAYANIGKFCSISWDVTIGAIGHPMCAISTHAFSFQRRFGLCVKEQKMPHEYVEIMNDVWIGCGVVIMPGVHIGNGAIIGAGAVVTHPVDDYEVVAGCPARHIGWRFEEDVRKALLQSEWWNWPDQVIRNHIDLFSPNNDITKDKAIVEQLKNIKNEENPSVSHC